MYNNGNIIKTNDNTPNHLGFPLDYIYIKRVDTPLSNKFVAPNNNLHE